MPVFLEKASCPACKRPAIVVAHGLSYCGPCQLVKLEKTSQYDFLTFNGELADCRPRGASFDMIVTGHENYIIVADYCTAADFFASADRLESFPEGASVYFDFAPSHSIYFSVREIKSSWASNFINYFSRLDCGEKITALDYYLFCLQDNLDDWRDAFICDYCGDNESAISSYADYLQESGMYSDANIPSAYINWPLIAQDSWFNGDVFFTEKHVFSNI